ncbi:tRNA 3'-trailer sequence RNase, putative [Plasmodium ovale curtisi]|uniref:ribonuclease Z n=1 Tax=Plasmodium ovale curtisi TaxID=864141 RepID=A0A1A8WY52_PLAOA|nr:tRNA 3'-trailer sequence RNase, putative [Plasmodium ovale curtisi]
MIGWHRLAIPSSLRLFVNGDFTLFNCGENNQRFLNEHKMHIAKIRNICFTKINPETIGGLIGLLLTIDNISENVITVFGPKPIERIINIFTCSFAKMKNIKIIIHEITCNNAPPIVLKGNVTITPIVFNEKDVTTNDNMQVINDSKKVDIDGKKNTGEMDNMDEEKNAYSHKYATGNGSYTVKSVNCFKKRKIHNGEDTNDRYNNMDDMSESRCGVQETNMHGNEDKETSERKSDSGVTPICVNRPTQKKQKCICYLIECPQTLGKFHVEKAKRLNIPSGKYYGILKSGKSITINNKIIKPEDVCDKNIDGRKSLVIDLCNVEDINDVIEKISNNECLYLKNVEYIFHLSNDEIINKKRYKQYFLSLKNVKNIKCNQSNSSLNICPFIFSSSLNNFLSKLLPNIFLKYKPDTPIYDLSSLMQKDDCKKDQLDEIKQNNFPIYVNGQNERDNENACNKVNNALEETTPNGNENEEIFQEDCTFLSYNTLTKFILHPFHKINICTNEMLSDLYPNIFNSSKISNILKENYQLVKTFENFNKKVMQNFSEFPSFYFLGTGCSMPSTYRNVSGIILNIQKNYSVVLDFGEGSLYQLYWMSKSWFHFSEAIKSIKIIFISHAHADHHAGLYYLLYMRKILFPHLDHPLILIPLTLKKWMDLFQELFLDKPINVLYNEENLEIKERINKEDNICLHLFKVQEKELYPLLHQTKEKRSATPFTLQVNHIKESYGIKIENKHVGSVVYSADTRPCDNVRKFSKECDVLIHEATFDDELLCEAIQKRHSTIHEALKISLEVKCKTLILTHFSQRYPKVIFLNRNSNNIYK